ncbi:MAG: 4-hydroxy-3-methylbut-2-enyl diphosphate reductase [Pseudomonadota bacterium]
MMFVPLEPELKTKAAKKSKATDSRRLTVRIAAPRGFCAGVSRAIQTVEETLSKYGAPVFVRHEIVHNAHVVQRLAQMGAVFVDEVDDAPADRPIVFSAHGVATSVKEAAYNRDMVAIDATCPLVLKVHNQTRRWHRLGYQVLLVGHEGHPEIEGTLGQAPNGTVLLVRDENDAQNIQPTGEHLAYTTQTTLSADETEAIIAILKRRFPAIEGPSRADICYATTNRQEAVKAIAPGCDAFFVIGDPTSSNSVRLVETARAAGAATSTLVPDPENFDTGLMTDLGVIGVSSGASAPEELVEAFLGKLALHHALDVETVEVTREDIAFKMPVI